MVGVDESSDAFLFPSPNAAPAMSVLEGLLKNLTRYDSKNSFDRAD